MELQLQSCGTLIGFDYRDNDRGGRDSSGKFHDKGFSDGYVASIGIENADGFVVKPTLAFMQMIAAENDHNAIDMHLAQIEHDNNAWVKSSLRKTQFGAHVHILPDVTKKTPYGELVGYQYLRDKGGQPIPTPKQAEFNKEPWLLFPKHSRPVSSKGALGREYRTTAYFCGLWQFNLKIELSAGLNGMPIPAWLSDATVKKLYQFAGTYVGVGAGRTEQTGRRKESGKLYHQKGRFIVC